MWGDRLAAGTAILFVACSTSTEPAAGAAGNGRERGIHRGKACQGRLIWFDAEANLWELANRRAVAQVIAKCKAVNLDTIIVDVKPLSGLVLYKSKLAPRLSDHLGKRYPTYYDLLQTVVEEGHKAGLAVHAAVNVFSEGSTKLGRGPAFDHPEWQCVEYGIKRTLTAGGRTFDLACSDKVCSAEDLYLYDGNAEAVGSLPENTAYVRVQHDGTPIQYGVATGLARIASPEKGYVVVGLGEAGRWLKKMYDLKARFELHGKKKMCRVSDAVEQHNALFVNPLDRDVRNYELTIIREICTNYAVDGIVLDRMRYPNIYSDFSELTRLAFERQIGRKVERWPEDIYVRDVLPGGGLKPGPLFKQWLKFRAQVIREFLSEVRQVAKSARPSVQIGVYVGSWYPLYYEVGVNWGSPTNCCAYDWWPDGYENTGYADLVDYLCTGCYYAHPTREEAKAHSEEQWKSVEAAAEESINAVKSATRVYGSLYLLQYNGSPDRFRRAVQQCLDKTHGCMLFDLVYIRNYDWWDLLKEVFSTSTTAARQATKATGQQRRGAEFAGRQSVKGKAARVDGRDRKS